MKKIHRFWKKQPSLLCIFSIKFYSHFMFRIFEVVFSKLEFPVYHYQYWLSQYDYCLNICIEISLILALILLIFDIYLTLLFVYLLSNINVIIIYYLLLMLLLPLSSSQSSPFLHFVWSYWIFRHEVTKLYKGV